MQQSIHEDSEDGQGSAHNNEKDEEGSIHSDHEREGGSVDSYYEQLEVSFNNEEKDELEGSRVDGRLQRGEEESNSGDEPDSDNKGNFVHDSDDDSSGSGDS